VTRKKKRPSQLISSPHWNNPEAREVTLRRLAEGRARYWTPERRAAWSEHQRQWHAARREAKGGD
jgi:hypothetical protein